MLRGRDLGEVRGDDVENHALWGCGHVTLSFLGTPGSAHQLPVPSLSVTRQTESAPPGRGSPSALAKRSPGPRGNRAGAGRAASVPWRPESRGVTRPDRYYWGTPQPRHHPSCSVNGGFFCAISGIRPGPAPPSWHAKFRKSAAKRAYAILDKSKNQYDGRKSRPFSSPFKENLSRNLP